MIRIALLGATSHVAKATMEHLRLDATLTHVARSPGRVAAHLNRFGCAEGEASRILSFEAFEALQGGFDAIVNCVGFGTPEKVAAAGLEMYRLTDRMDEICLRYIERDPRAVYINFSSGAVYGTSQDLPVGEAAVFSMDLNRSENADHYRLAKLHCERKHRAFVGASIVDLRLFSLFSRHIELSSQFFVCEILRAIREKKIFRTGAQDMVRDFVHPSDLADLVLRAARSEGLSTALDVYSRGYLRKSELLAAAQERFGLQVNMEDAEVGGSPTGLKFFYASVNTAASRILGYAPVWCSLDAVVEQMELALRR